MPARWEGVCADEAWCSLSGAVAEAETAWAGSSLQSLNVHTAARQEPHTITDIQPPAL